MQKIYKPGPNSFKNTFCVFQEVHPSTVDGKTIDFESQSGSSYYYTQKGMYRFSNHWGRLANSKWRLRPMKPETESKYKLGFAEWQNFFPDNPTDKLYYLEMDYESNTVLYQHKNNPEYDNKAVLRTSINTRKRIKQLRNIINLTSWANHFDYDDIEDLREKIIHELIYTDKTLEEIKRQLQ